jgi:hypothetical protein
MTMSVISMAIVEPWIPAFSSASNPLAQDGVKDGVVDDPRLCRFEPSSLLCRGTGQSQCLTAQVVAVEKTRSGPKNPLDRRVDLSVVTIDQHCERGMAGVVSVPADDAANVNCAAPR